MAEIKNKNSQAISVGFELADLILSKEGWSYICSQCDAVHILFACYMATSSDQNPKKEIILDDSRKKVLESFYHMILG